MLTGIILYYLSLKGCSIELGDGCFTKDGIKFYYQRVAQCSISAIISCIIFLLAIIKRINKYFAIFQFFFYLTNFYFNTGSDTENHGYYNSFIFIIINIFVFLIFYIFNLFYYLFKKKKFIIASIIVILTLIFFFYINIHSYNDCKYWGYGLSDSKIQTKEEALKNGDACYISRPKRCLNKMITGKEDLSKFTKINCKKQDSNQYKVLTSFLPPKLKNATNLGFPNTAKMNTLEDIVYSTFHYRIFENFIDLDNITEKQKNDYPEVTLHFNSKKEGKVNIEIKPNETLIQERRKLYEENKDKIKFDNILILYIDSISREQMFRSLPKTMEFIEKYYIKNKKKEKEFNTYQFLKYQNFAALTRVNAFPMFYGTSFSENNRNFFAKYYKQNGFIAAQTNDYCGKEFFGLNKSVALTVDTNEFDHENVALFCDPNYSTPNFFFTIEKGPYSPRRRCLYGKDVYEYVFEYSTKFLETYKNEKKILRMGFNDAHESTGEVIRYMDEPLKNFIKYYLDNHMTEKSMIIFLSDHGNSMPDLNELLLSQDKEIEKTLGMLFLIYPNLNVKNDSLYNNTALLLNEQTLITPYEIYATLLDNLGLNSSYYHKEKSSPLDKEIDVRKRNCELYYEDFKFYSENFELCRCRDINH
jgi:hypothetical protein